MGDDANDRAVVTMMVGECLAVRVRLLNRVITALYDEALRPFGLRVNQSNLLVAVARMGTARPTDLARILKMEKSTVSRDAEILRREGWLEADPPGGGRNHTLTITPRGMDLLHRARPAWEAAQAEAARLLGDPGTQSLREIAARLGFPSS